MERQQKEAYSTGKVVSIGPVQQISEKFSKREFVILTPGQYPKTQCFELINDKTTLISNYKTDDSVVVHYNLESRAWEKDGVTKYFTSAKAWKIEADNGAFSPANESAPVDDTDLPF